MSSFRPRLAALVALTLPLALFTGILTPKPEPAFPEKPRLAVLVFFDQLRGDYLTRWDELFGQGGFHRLEQEGAWFQNCHYPYSDTVTGAGHASVVAGCSPNVHGIIGNDWFDRQAGVVVNCVGSERYERVPPRTRIVSLDKVVKKPVGVSPERLLAPTLADALREATGGRGRVVSLSLKDRSAVLPGGRRPDACYWLDTTHGEFVTSTYYRDRPHPWVEEFNRSRVLDAWVDKDWTRQRPELNYEACSGPDDEAGEGTPLLSRTFPHPLGILGTDKLKAAYYGALFTSPFGNDVLLELARRAVTAEKLGSRDTPDLLCLSFSSNDAIGHCWGPDSQEMLDVTLRSDRTVRQLLTFLDKQVGKGKYVLVLTADHGVCPLPEVARQRGEDAGRIDAKLLLKKAGAFLGETFHVPAEEKRWIEPVEDMWLYLHREMLMRHHLRQPDVEAALAGWLRKQPGIQDVITRSQLVAGVAEGDVVGRHVQKSFYPERSGDLRILQKPNYLITTRLTGTTHGTPYEYDTHVPLLVCGAGVRPGVRHEAVTPQVTAVILAHVLGIAPPAKAEADMPANLITAR
jgi:predicted AlkP superfamily pyrophosphatase or phosphodiesterase